jgi:glycosyltransferase involved in cell wall biosynthesis
MVESTNETAPRVSVLLPVYNDAQYVRAGIDSILKQTFTDFELIIVDDGSTDESPRIISQYRDPRLRVVRNQCNLGLAPSLNIAIAASRGEYLARQDADDISLPQRFARQVEFLDTHPLVGVVGSRAIAIDEDGKELHLIQTSSRDYEIKWDLLFFCPFVHSSVMVRRSVLNKSGTYTEDPEIARAFVEDYDLWSRINRITLSANIPEPLQKYRYRKKPTSASTRTRTENERQQDKISQRNICWLLGRSEIRPKLWAALKVFSPVQSRENLEQMTPEETRQALDLLIAVEDAFCRKYVPEHRKATHKLWQHAQWAKRMLVLAKSNQLDKSCRLALVRGALKLLLAACLEPAQDRSAGM